MQELGICVNGGFALWHRVGTGGPIAKAIGTTTSFRAERNGRLMLIAKPPGEWLNATGRFDPDYPHAGATGATRIVALWLIAVSIFQKRKGICSFARIKLKSDKGEIFVGP